MTKFQKPGPKRGGKKKAAPKQGLKAPVRGRVHKPIPPAAPAYPTVEEQYIADGHAGALTAHTSTPPIEWDDLPAPPPPGPTSKWWRQYQDTETGFFIGWIAAAKLTKDQVISRLRLRKPKRAD